MPTAATYIFDLRISFRYVPTNMDQHHRAWREVFNRASKMLFHATEGQMQLGKLTVSHDSRGTANADVFVEYSDDPAARAHATTGGYYSNVGSIKLYNNHAHYPYSIVHELGHYVMSLADEYETMFGAPAICQPDARSGACIMQFGREYGERFERGSWIAGDVTEFCCDANHGPGTAQRNDACWSTMHQTHSNLVIPRGLPSGATLANHQEVTWLRVQDTDRFVIVLDDGLPFADSAVNEGLFTGLTMLARVLSMTDNQVSFVGLGGQVLAPWARADDSLIKSLWESDGPQQFQPRIVLSSLQQVGELIAGQDLLAANQRILLLSSGVEAPDDFDPWAAVRSLPLPQVHAITSSTSGEVSTLDQIARQSRGRLSLFDNAENDDAARSHAAFAVLANLNAIDNVELVELSSYLLPACKERTDAAWSPTRRPIDLRATEIGIDVPVLIEHGSSRAIFAIHYSRGESFHIQLIDPTGFPVPLKKDGIDYDTPADVPYRLAAIPWPIVGKWILRIYRMSARRDSLLTVLAASKNANLHIRWDVQQPADDRSLEITASVYYQGMIERIDPPIVQITNRDPESASREKIDVVLRPRHFVSADLDHSVYQPNGIYSATVPVPRPGAYEVRIRLASNGAHHPAASGMLHATTDWRGEELRPFVRVDQKVVVVR